MTKLTDLRAERQKRRRKTGWTVEEIKKSMDQRRAFHENTDVKEPENWAFGDMEKLLREKDGEQK